MPASQTLARRLIQTMIPWFVLIAAGMAAAQITVQYFSINGAINRDLASLGRTVAPPMAEAVWELDQAALDSLARGLMLNAIVTGVSVANEKGETLVVEGVRPAGSHDAEARRFSLTKKERVRLQYLSQRGTQPLIGSLEISSGPRVVWGSPSSAPSAGSCRRP